MCCKARVQSTVVCVCGGGGWEELYSSAQEYMPLSGGGWDNAPTGYLDFRLIAIVSDQSVR